MLKHQADLYGAEQCRKERDALRALLIECLDIDFIGTGNLEQRIRNALEGGKE